MPKTDMKGFSKSYLNMDLLRFTTAGSVDDGKSTLIGRLLYSTKSIFEDQLQSIEKSSKQRGHEEINLALVTDGLRAEREQGITIDVAYKYFATPKRKFIIADTPGHVQYTRNMVTGASTANLAIILIDARKGVIEQTKRHSFIASLLQIPHVAVCVNKMDLVDYSEEVFNTIVKDFENFSAKMDVSDVMFIPVNALKGDNVVERSENMDWYQGSTLLSYLENVHIASDFNFIDPRFPVQYVIRPQAEEYHDYRGFAGRVASGVFKKGEEIVALPSGKKSRIKAIDTLEGEIDEAYPPLSVAIRLEDEIDISRGDMLVRENNRPNSAKEFQAMVCWMSEKPLQLGGKYSLLHTSNSARCMITDILYKTDINQLTRNEKDKTIGMNDIGKISVKTIKPIFFDAYRSNRQTGSFVLIDEATNETVGACMIT